MGSAAESTPWERSRPGLPIGPDEVAIWRIPLAATAEELAAARRLLGEDELRRADRFFREADRVAFTIQRAGLRAHLAAYLGSRAAEIRFTRNERGKPEIEGPGGWLRFNASGSGEWGLLAFSASSPVGVDLERHRDLDCGGLARQFFSAEEAAELDALPHEQQTGGFFNAWSRKEAFVKALGQGLYYPLGRFTVTLSPGAPARLLSIDGSRAHALEWSLMEVPAAPGYAAAVVRQGGPFTLRLHASPPLSQWAFLS